MNFFTDDIANGINWKGLEKAVARMMGHLGWKDVNVIGGAGDKGADILADRKEGEHVKAWVVQSKAMSGDRYIGPNAIDEAIKALSFYDTQVAAVATNGEFTQTAMARQKQLEKNGYLVRTRNLKDERVVEVSLTDKAKDMITKLDSLFDERFKNFFENENDEDLEVILRALKKLSERFTQMNESLNKKIKEE